ncbi:polysaccharide biosynthesis protein [Priestia flexa]|uniref:putative polysaccharide biosynthesis protein n=1 Tax=Priestia flexa TaxID=86664 RepID=UPI000C232233|nr:polysaccharide biosynthesis protein [Priestia flexa]MEC0668426.1 polysaccharide biosynthesis protein [Priestia flexa]
MNNKLVRGTFFLTAATFISKILGFVYIIPFMNLVGDEGYALYKYAYGPYGLMISLSTMGLPLAVSKYVSKYNGLGNYRASQDLLKFGLFLMMVTGFIACATLYALAPTLAHFVVGRQDGSGNSIDDVVYVIRMVSFALLIIPAMSLLRGYFQGNQSMGPSALSTVIEQVVRVLFIVCGAYAVLTMFNGSITSAVGVATFGAVMGGGAGLLILVTVYQKRKHFIYKQVQNSRENKRIPIASMLKELLSYSIPFVIVGLAIPIYQNIDTFTINALFQSIGYTQEKAETVNAVIGLAQILVMIPVSLATAFGMSLLPSITTSYTKGEINNVKQKITQVLQLFFFLTLPVAVGLSLLAKPVYRMIFSSGSSYKLGGFVLQWYAPMAILFGLFTITAAILQGINQQKKVIAGLLIGIILKLSLNIALLSSFKELTPILATYVGYGVSVLYNFHLIKKALSYRIIPELARMKISIVHVTFMGIVVFIMSKLLTVWLAGAVQDYTASVLTAILSAIAGAGIYMGCSFSNSEIRDLFKKPRRKVS